MTIDAVETSEVYFTAYKEAAQTITGGPEVTVYTTGTVDGEEAGETKAVIAVRTGDLVFDGGPRSFTLNVSEEGKTGRTIAVTLNVGTNETGAAVFRLMERVDGVDSLERIGGDDANFNGFLAAFEWLEENAEANREYTIRVEKDEGIPRLVVSLNNAENAVLRRRGTKNGPFTLKYDSIKGKIPIDKGNLGSLYTFIQIGPTRSPKNAKKTVILGHNVTLEGMPVTSRTDYCILLEVGHNATLVLEPGSTITKFDSTFNNVVSSPIYIASSMSSDRIGPEYHGALRIEGGAITECTFLSQAYLIIFSTKASWLTENSFTLKPDSGLILENNTANSLGAYGQGSSPNLVLDLRDYLAGGLVIPPFPATE
jgi:hypothetical protein